MRKQFKRFQAFSLVALQILAAVLIITSGGCAPASSMNSPAGPAPKHIVLSWTGDAKTTQTITWQTDSAAKGQIRYAEMVDHLASLSGGKIIDAAMQEITTNKGIRYVHSVTINGLRPGSYYMYQAGSGAVWSEARQFKTAPASAGQFSFLIFGDSQSTDYDVWGLTLHKAAESNPAAVFAGHVGDLVDVGQDYAEWDAWFIRTRGIFESLPLMPAVGNHETYTPERKLSPPVLFKELFTLPRNGPQLLAEQAYSFDYGDAHFVVLDSQVGEQRQFYPDMLERQERWLDKDLSQTQKRWKIVFLHRPPYDNKSFQDNVAVRNAFTPLFDKHKVDIVFSGHDHVYARTYRLRGGKPDSDGTVYVAAGRSGTKTYQTVRPNPLNEVFYNPLAEPNYLVVEVMPDRLAIKAFKQSGTLIDSWFISKPMNIQQ